MYGILCGGAGGGGGTPSGAGDGEAAAGRRFKDDIGIKTDEVRQLLDLPRSSPI
jgi:hypothetical protein